SPIPHTVAPARPARCGSIASALSNMSAGSGVVAMASGAVRELLEILDLEPLEVNLFRGRSPQSRWQRVFGGQVIRQALVGARPPPLPPALPLAARPPALAARLFPARRRPEGAHLPPGRPPPRRPQLYPPPRHRDPARPRDLLDVGVVPRRRGRLLAPGRYAA